MTTKQDYDKLSKSDQDKHHEQIRADLIEKGLVKPNENKS